MTQQKTVGETLIDLLEANGVEVVFGIPGVHTAELYRGLAGSPIRHVTPRHEQGAGFMADGYARVSGKPGVCFVITGPGLTNTITAMAQASEDSVPMLVISGVNARDTLGKGRGCLHELPDQQAMMATFAKSSRTLMNADDLPATIEHAFATLASGRPGPVHIEIPTDVMTQRIAAPAARASSDTATRLDSEAIERAVTLCGDAGSPVVIAGGGASGAGAELQALAEKLDAPVVLTTNARGLMAGHPLTVPASPSLAAVRDLIRDADLVIGAGTQFGPTDFDMYEDHGFPDMKALIRIDVDAGQIAAGPHADVELPGTAETVLASLAAQLRQRSGGDGSEQARRVRAAAWAGLSDKLRREVGIIHAIRDALPGAVFVGDSTQLVYAGNLWCEPAGPKRWFNSATGYGALGYGPPAAIGAAIADPKAPVVCIVGDGGLQFSMGELGTAMDEGVNVIFLVWNNRGYQEIENFMVAAGIEPEGVKPSPPDMEFLAKAYGLEFRRVVPGGDLAAAMAGSSGPILVEYVDTRVP